MDWKGVSYNPNLTIKFIEGSSRISMGLERVSYNPNLTMEFFENHPDYDWDWYGLMKNEFIKEKEMFMIEEARKYILSIRSKNCGKKFIIHPILK